MNTCKQLKQHLVAHGLDGEGLEERERLSAARDELADGNGLHGSILSVEFAASIHFGSRT